MGKGDGDVLGVATGLVVDAGDLGLAAVGAETRGGELRKVLHATAHHHRGSHYDLLCKKKLRLVSARSWRHENAYLRRVDRLLAGRAHGLRGAIRSRRKASLGLGRKRLRGRSELSSASRVSRRTSRCEVILLSGVGSHCCG